MADLPGLYVVELVVNDGVQPSLPDSVAVTAETPLLSVEATDASAAEPGADPGRFTLTRTGPLAGPLLVDFDLGGSATNGADYAALDLSVSFAPGQATASLEVVPIDDPLVEGDETVTLTLLDGADYDLGAPSEATLTIADNPAPVVTVVAADATASEAGDTGSFEISRTGDLAFPLQVSLALAGTATNGVDYVALPSSLTIPAGAVSASLVVVPIDDGDLESSEGVQLLLAAGPDYVVGSPGQAIVTITDDDILVSVFATDPLASEYGPDAGAFSVSRLGPATQPLTVLYQVSGTAAGGVDYVALPGSVTIPAGAGAAMVAVEPIDDALFEGPEDVVLTLGPGPGYTVGAVDTARVTIEDDERPAVSIFVTDGTAGEAGPDPGAFSITRTGPTDGVLTVFYAVNGSATEGVDYEALAGSVSIPAGASSAPVAITPIDDDLTEGAENVLLTLSPDPAYVVATPGIAGLNIADDDIGVVTIEATDPDASEAGLESASFTLSRTGDLGAPLMVILAASGSAGTADYETISLLVTIPAGLATATVVLTPRADNLVEGPETLTLTIQPNLAYVVGVPGAATASIADDPAIVSVVASDPEASELGPDPGSFVVTRSGGNLAAALTPHFSLGGTAANAGDYSFIGGSVTIPAGQTAAAVTVTPLRDNVVEGPETVVLSLSPSTGMAYLVGSPSSATVEIADDPALVTVVASDPDAAEAGLDPGAFSFTRTGGNPAAALNVFFSKGGTATNGIDYSGIGGAVSLVVIPANQASADVAIEPFPDNLVEGPETVSVELAASSAYLIGSPASATVTIADDPPLVSVTATDPDAAEAGPDPGSFTFTRSGGKLAASLSVGFSRSGTATHGADYAAIGASVTIPAGQAAAAVTITPIDDSLLEGAETVVLTVNPSGSVVPGTPATASVTIADDE